jgi:diguanylate cyclase (GGDEF)-like protein
LDEFKWINDNLGHETGDQALKGATQVLKNTFRDADIIARLGGDEFVVLLADSVQEVNVEGLKKRLFEGLADWNKKETRPYQLKMSVGVVQHDPKQHKSTQEFLTHADNLMYEQKRNKKRVPAS